MRLAVVILNYNTPGDTIACLKSLKQAKLPKGLHVETTLVDNASTDDSVDLIKSKFPEVRLIENITNQGFAGGNNVGIKAALEENPTHILLLNPDTLVDQDFFVSILNSAITNPKVGIVTPLIYFAKGYEFHQKYAKSELGKVVWSAGGQLDWANVYGTNAHVDEVDKGQFKQIKDTDFATGACMLIRRQVIDQIGLLNQNYFLYLEDLEFCQRAKRAGWRIVFDPSIKIWHKVSQSSGIGSSLNDYFITRNRLLFGLRYAPLRTKLALLREAIRFLISGRPAQKTAVADFFTFKLGRGSFLGRQS